MKWQAISTVARDVLSMALGTFITIHEELSSGAVRPELLGLAGVLLAGPTGIAIWHTVRGKGGRQGTVPTASSSSERL